jgi:hypothetical protein
MLLVCEYNLIDNLLMKYLDQWRPTLCYATTQSKILRMQKLNYLNIVNMFF